MFPKDLPIDAKLLFKSAQDMYVKPHYKQPPTKLQSMRIYFIKFKLVFYISIPKRMEFVISGSSTKFLTPYVHPTIFQEKRHYIHSVGSKLVWRCEARPTQSITKEKRIYDV